MKADEEKRQRESLEEKMAEIACAKIFEKIFADQKEHDEEDFDIGPVL